MFYFNNKTLSSSELKTYKPANAFEEKVKTFTLEWLSDKQEFSFQTSGSTGQPKKITFTRQQMEASARLTQQTFDLQRGQNALLCLDPDFVAGKMMIVRTLEIGMNLVVVEPSANPLEKLTFKDPIEFAAFVPYQLSAILQNPKTKEKLNNISKAIIGGASSSKELVESLQVCSTQFYETYGMTETLTHVAIRKLNPPELAFRALPGVTLWLNTNLCLSLQLDHLGIDRIETNDVVQLQTRDTFTVTGRYDNMINTAGLKVSPEMLELKIKDIMQKHFNDSAFFIGGVKDKQFGEKVVLFVEHAFISDSVRNIAFDQMKQVLRAFEVPKEIVAVPAFKRTEVGKLKRQETIQESIVDRP
jgi:O-succinylbenzoic acid--CoA ligase